MFTTTILPIDGPDTVAAVEAVLAADGIFVVPTDTVCGVCSRYDSIVALGRIYAAKDRPPQKALPVLIGVPEQLESLVEMPLHPLAAPLMARYWPGPLTLVLPAQAHLPPELTAGAPTVAVRMPNHAAFCALLRHTGPLAVTSANRSGQDETHNVPEVLAQLDGRVNLILADVGEAIAERGADVAGDADVPPVPPAGTPNLASTIVDLADAAAPPRILREGPLGAEIRAWLADHADRT